MDFKVKPIGFISSKKTYKLEAAKQSSDSEDEAFDSIEILSSYKQGLTELETVSHLWVIFIFDQAPSEKLMVQPPVGSSKKIGVFATRSPHRPNHIGMSLVKILEIKNNTIFISNSDLLDGTPVVDIKPYHPEADVAIDAKIGWITPQDCYAIEFSEMALRHLNYLQDHNLSTLHATILQQLRYEPTNHTKKRVKELSKDHYVYSYRTWRIYFSLAQELLKIQIEKIESGYSTEELKSTADPYTDKALHRTFNSKFRV